MDRILVLLSKGRDRQAVLDGWRPLLHRAHIIDLHDPSDLTVTDFEADVSIVDIELLAGFREMTARCRFGLTIVVVKEDDENGRLAAFSAGAADCIAATTTARELQARVAGLLQRRAGRAPGSRCGVNPCGNWYVHLAGRHLVSPSGDRVHVAPSEFDILATLAERPQRALSRDFLVAQLSSTRRICPRNIDVLVSRLRRSFAHYDPAALAYISTMRNDGYQLARPVSRDAHGITILGDKSA